MRWSLAILPVLMAGIAPWAVRAAPYEAAGVQVDITAVPEPSEVMMGEPSCVLFNVANRSDRDLRIMVGGDYRNRLGRPDSFKVEVVGSDGKKVPQPDAGFDKGGITSAENLPAKGDYVFRLFLPHWATFKKPGRYTMTIRRKLELVPNDGTDAFSRKPTAIDVAATATIEIVPADAAKLGKLIARWGEQMLDRSSEGAERAEQMLNAMHDERVIPYFATLAEKPHFSPRIAAARALGKYNSDEAFEALKKLTKTTAANIRDSTTTLALAESSAKSVHGWAVHSIAASPHPKAIPFLWTFANDPSHAVRLTLLHKAAELKTLEARGIIQKMTNDRHETVRNEALRYQKLLAKENTP